MGRGPVSVNRSRCAEDEQAGADAKGPAEAGPRVLSGLSPRGYAGWAGGTAPPGSAFAAAGVETIGAPAAPLALAGG